MLARILVSSFLTAISVTQSVHAIELQPATVNAWDAYLEIVRLHMQDRVDGKRPFLWMDESQDRQHRVRRGEVVIAPVVGRGTQPVPNGLVHHWVGAILIPGATIEKLKSVTQDYDSYEQVYKPVVVSSHALDCSLADREFSMIWQQRVLFVTAAIRGEYRDYDVMLDGRRGYDITEPIQIREIADFGRTTAHLMPPDTGSGFIWRIRSIARYEERNEGVYLEVEALALTRDIPTSLRWLIRPIINRLSIDSLAATLGQTRQAVNASSNKSRAVACRGRINQLAISETDLNHP